MGEVSVYSSKTFKIHYDDRDLIILQPLGYVLDKHWVEAGSPFFGIMKKTRCTRILVDQTQLKGSWLPQLAVLEKVLIPHAAKMGFLKLGFVYSDDMSTVHSLNRFLEMSGKFFDTLLTQAFYNRDNAIEWILDQEVSLSPPKYSDTISVRVHGTHQLIPLDDIFYIWSKDGYLNIVTKDDTYRTRSTIVDFKQRVPDFIKQIHKSYLVNTNYLDNISYFAGGSYKANLKGLPNIRLTIGRSYAPTIKKDLGIAGSW